MENGSKQINVFNVIIIDASGSMSSIYNQTLSSINETISGIRKSQMEHPEQSHYVTLVSFEGDGMKGVRTVLDRMKVDFVKDLTRSDYVLGGCTPLYDAIGSTVNMVDAYVNKEDSVLFTVITDGYENSSMEFSGREIKKIVSDHREKGWTFVYIGANQDAIEVARELSIANALSYDATPEGVVQMCIKYEKGRKRFADCSVSRSCEERGSIADFFSESDNK